MKAQVAGSFFFHEHTATIPLKSAKNRMFKTVIGVNSKLAEAFHARQPVLLYAPRARGCEEYQQLAKEMLKRMNTVSKQ